MRRVRELLGIVGMLGVMGAAGCAPGALSAATSAMQQQRAGVWVDVAPGTATAGFKVVVRADCADNSNPATVTSPAFGSVTVQPWNTLLQAEITIPTTTAEGRYDVTVTCQTGASATSSLTIIGGSGPVEGPHTGGGFLAADDATPGAVAWLAVGAGALALAGVLGTRSVRRRRRTAAR